MTLNELAIKIRELLPNYQVSLYLSTSSITVRDGSKGVALYPEISKITDDTIINTLCFLEKIFTRQSGAI